MKQETCIFLADKPSAENSFFVRKKEEPLGTALQNNLHWHDFYEMELICGGSGTHLVNGIVYPLHRGCVYLLTPADFHAVREDPADPLALYNLNFHENMLPQPLAEQLVMLCGPLTTVVSGTVLEQLEQQFSALLDEFTAKRSFRPLMLRARMEELCITFLRAASESRYAAYGTSAANDAGSYYPVQQAVSYIKENFRRDITLAETAAYVHLTPNYLGELFYHRIGLSFSCYLRRLRFSYAVQLLLSSTLSIAEISKEAGFGTPSYFSALFRQSYGVTPKVFRAAHINLSKEDIVSHL